VRFIGVASRDDLEPIQEFVSEFEVGAFEHAVDMEADIWSHYGIWTQPAFAFINDAGVVEVFLGPMGLDGLSAMIEKVLLQ